MNFDEAVELSLRTWYPKDHPLHMNPHHPLGKLLGEWGELLDDYMKSLYKPGYVFEPEDELGDIWYYVRILCYQKNYYPSSDLISFSLDCGTEYIIARIMMELAKVFGCKDKNLFYFLDVPFSGLIEIANRYNLTLDQLTASNWQKLKPGSERGEQWAKARVNTEYTGGKIGLR